MNEPIRIKVVKQLQPQSAEDALALSGCGLCSASVMRAISEVVHEMAVCSISSVKITRTETGVELEVVNDA